MFKNIFRTLTGLGSTETPQPYVEYFDLFPTLTETTTFTSEEMLTYPKSDKKMLSSSYFNLIRGTGEWGPSRDMYTGREKIYPLGKIELSKTVTVIFLELVLSYEEGDNTQMKISVMTYKKDGTALRAEYRDGLIYFGGDAKNNTFMYSGKFETDGKSWIKTIQTGTGDVMKHNHTYSISSKGLSLDENE